jgi:hypothetical protein
VDRKGDDDPRPRAVLGRAVDDDVPGERADEEQAAAALRLRIGGRVERSHPAPAVDDAEHRRVLVPVDADAERRGAVADRVREQLADDELGRVEVGKPIVRLLFEKAANLAPNASDLVGATPYPRPVAGLVHVGRLCPQRKNRNVEAARTARIGVKTLLSG